MLLDVAGRTPHVQRGAGEKSLPIFGVDYDFLWSKAAAVQEDE